MEYNMNMKKNLITEIIAGFFAAFLLTACPNIPNDDLGVHILGADTSGPISAPSWVSVSLNTNALNTNLRDVLITWEPVPGAESYSIYRSFGSADVTFQYLISTGSPSFTNTSIPLNEVYNYYYRVVTHAAKGRSNLSSAYGSLNNNNSNNDPNNPSGLPGSQLSLGVWQGGTISAGDSHYYYFHMTQGTTYRVSWSNNNYQGDGTANISIFANQHGTGQVLWSSGGYTNEYRATAPSSGYIILKVEASSYVSYNICVTSPVDYQY
jgi:hypothetical protein